MSLDPRAIATLGIGYAPLLVASLGLLPNQTPVVEPPAPQAIFGGQHVNAYDDHEETQQRRRRNQQQITLTIEAFLRTRER